MVYGDVGFSQEFAEFQRILIRLAANVTSLRRGHLKD